MLRRVLGLYDDQGWKPVVAPELEFFLVKINTDPDYPLDAADRPLGPAGDRRASPIGIDAVNEFDPIFEDVYDCCEAQEIDVDTLTHETGAAQMEINFNHGDPLELADQAFLFKRTVRQAALQARHLRHLHGQAAWRTSPAAPCTSTSRVLDATTGRNLFADRDGEPSPSSSCNHIGGLQRYPAAGDAAAGAQRELLPPPAAAIRRAHQCPLGHRQPHRGPARADLRTGSRAAIENRLAGADANPYLAIAASLACGYLGMIERDRSRPSRSRAAPTAWPTPCRSTSTRPCTASAAQAERGDPGRTLRRASMPPVKQTEHEAYQRVISSWEREHLLLNV